jgi:hypothetical protein
MNLGSQLVDLFVTRRKPSTFVVLACILSLGASLALAVLGWWLLKPDAVKSLANIVGYLGGLAFFVPSAIAMAVSNKKTRLDQLIDGATDNATRAGLEKVRQADAAFYENYKAQAEVFHIVGLFLIALAFCLQI